MSNYIRSLVSGNKARYKDKDLNLDLDLAYITDNVIVMGYPAAGLEGLYRNRREDAKKFLQHRHGNNFWIFNFCPIRENSYPASFFDGRVSRYPFPDHHAPPLAILPLIAREMRLWLQGSAQRVAVLHCKAGKGRSGTMACSYLLSLDDAAPPTATQTSGTVKARAEERANEVMAVMPADEDADDARAAAAIERSASPLTAAASPGTVLDKDLVHSPHTTLLATDASEHPALAADSKDATLRATASPAPAATNSQPASLQSVLELHTSKRMKPAEDAAAKAPKAGVSIPSQRRWLLYWSLLLAGSGPRGFWGISPDADNSAAATEPSPKVRVRALTVRMREPRGVAAGLTRAVNAFAEQTALRNRNAPRSKGGAVWVSLARYDDGLVAALERWERHSRGAGGKLGVRAPGADHMEGEALERMFEDGKWDKDKMVRSFARVGAVTPEAVSNAEDKDKSKIVVHRLTPLSDMNWEGIRDGIVKDDEASLKDANGVASEAASINDETGALRTEGGIIVDAFREMRGKLYMGQVFFGWFWLIPAFHMPERVPGQARQPPTRFLLTRKDVDFPLGVGEALVDVEVEMEWCDDNRELPAKQSSKGSSGGATGFAANVAPVLPGV